MSTILRAIGAGMVAFILACFWIASADAQDETGIASGLMLCGLYAIPFILPFVAMNDVLIRKAAFFSDKGVLVFLADCIIGVLFYIPVNFIAIAVITT
jgi:hypothetical protein